MIDDVRRLADAVLYEGHVLWPYRRSSIKNRQRWTFGGVYPQAYARSTSDRSVVQTECLVEGDAPAVDVEVRFLHVVHRQASDGARAVDEIGGYLTWDETTERAVLLSVEPGAAASSPIRVPAGEHREALPDGLLVRTWAGLEGMVEASLERLDDGLHRVRVRVRNTSPWPHTDRDGAIRRSMLSAHALLRARVGRLVSATDPPERLRPATDELCNEGLWPVLVGEDGARDTMLASPIILADYTRVAPESPGDFFDGGEIDQLLVLNILGLTDDEKREVRAGDPRAREVLERTEAMTPDELMRLNGALRTSVWDELERPGPESVLIDGIEVRRGTRVRMHPADRRDILSAAIDGRTGVVESIEELMEGGVRLAVSPHDDPGRDLGPARPGHRFFFTADEVEPLARVLVAGIGNMFLGDDGFGCAVAQRLLDEPMPAGVDVVDYGIRGFDLAYALASGYESALLIDAAPLGEPAGTLAVIHAPADDGGEPEIDTHGMEPTRVLRLARELGPTPGRVLVLACQPAQLVDAGELSPPVRAAVETALPEVRRLVEKLLNDEREGGA